jgi:2,3-bisphosphoglycerate-independent phosphoglycerate mutase
LANCKNTKYFESVFPTTYLKAAGESVGLPENFMGNSEVGHITIGTGKVSDQSLLKINKSIENGSFLINKEILYQIQNIKTNKSRLHLMILMQDAGVHSHINHLFEVLKFCRKEGLKNDQVALHLITDGRDSEQNSAIAFLAEVAETMTRLGVGIVATISGRFFAMDRNNNISRTDKYFDALFYGKSEHCFSCGMDAINNFYKQKISDEFIVPMIKNKYDGISNDDSVIMLNFRKDRMIQISNKVFERLGKNLLTMTNYSGNKDIRSIFSDNKVENSLSDILEENSKNQLRISETEKFAHVTFFFDGGVKKDHKNKTKILIESPKVQSYSLCPEMSSEILSKRIDEEIKTEKYDFILVNYPNVDMVAHSGDIQATIKAVEVVDKHIGDVVEVGLKHDYTILLTADHGNAEEVSFENHRHTKNKVPFTIISPEFKNKKGILKKEGVGLKNIAATILEIMKIKKPKIMEDGLFLEN